jgi:diacylglycerol O-acyltransferase
MSIDRLTTEDQLMLRWDEIWPPDVGAIAVLEGTGLFDLASGLRIDAVRKAMEGRLHLVPRFRQLIYVPRRGLGGPLWLDSRDFDLRRHVRVLPLAADSGDAELLRAVEQLRRQRLDRSRPLWEIWFLPGLPGRRVGLFVRMHHAIGDGRAAMTMLGAFLDPVPDAPAASAPPWIPAPPPSARELLADNLLRRLKALAGALSVTTRPRTTVRHVLGAWPAMRELLAEEPASATSLDRMVGPDRNLALIRTTLDLVRRVGHAHDATVNDVLLAVTAGGLRALLLSRGEPVQGVTVRIYVPVSLRRRLRGAVQGNRISEMAVPLSLGVSDPCQRLRQIAAETAKRKARSRTSLGTLFRVGIVSRLMLKAIIRQRVNITSASIPGPRRPLYLAGARILELFPVVNLLGNQPLGVGALSYAGTFNIGVVADRDAYPDIDVFAAAVRDELHGLAVRSVSTSVAPAALPSLGSPSRNERAVAGRGRELRIDTR